MTWCCDVCHAEMIEDGDEVYCPECGNSFVIDEDGNTYNPSISDDEDLDYELAKFCRGGDITDDD